MAAKLIVTGMAPSNPIALTPPTISGLIAWVYFGNLFGSDNTNIAPGGSAFVNVGSGPEAVEENYVRCWYNAASRTAWRRYTDGSDGAVTLVAVGRATIRYGSAVANLIGDSRVSMMPKQIETANSSLPSISSYRFAVAGPVLTIPTAMEWRAYALTEPAGGVAGTSRIMDLTADAEATASQNGQTSNNGSDNYMTFGTVGGNSSGSRKMDIAFAAIVAGTQMSKADIQSDIMTPARSVLALRGISGV